MHNRIASLLDAHKKYWPESNNAQLLPLRFSLFYAQLEQHARATEIIAANHLSVAEFDVLATLRRSPPPYVLTPSDIQNSMLISSGGLTKVLLELESRGFVSRTSNESDRRIKPVMLNINTLSILNKVMIELENVFKPKKRVFVSLTLASAVIGAMVIYMAWRVALPGLEQINAKLPVVFGGIGIAIALALLAGVAGIVLAILGVPIMKIFYFWAWKAVNILFPFAVVLGRIFDIPRSKIEQSFIEVSNHLVKQHRVKVPADRIMILTPHCIQLDTCVHKITRNIENCRQCGGCSVGDMLGLAHKYGIHMAVATGGTLARQMVKQIRPKAIVAVACERDLTSGIQDVFPLPVVGVLNERPFGPCFNTRVDIKRVEAAVLDFLEVEEKHGEH